jgi:RNA polymerase sigma factor (TIGR02999 family)
MLDRFRAGDSHAAVSLVAIFYNELHRIAVHQMRGEDPGHTLQPTALVNELCFKMAQQKPKVSTAVSTESEVLRTEGDFFRLARYLMTQILIEHARAKRALKRRHIKIELEEALETHSGGADRESAILGALDVLEKQDPELRRLIDLRFFCGHSVAETARLLGVGQGKVKAEWRVARLWLQRNIGELEEVAEED